MVHAGGSVFPRPPGQNFRGVYGPVMDLSDHDPKSSMNKPLTNNFNTMEQGGGHFLMRSKPLLKSGQCGVTIS